MINDYFAAIFNALATAQIVFQHAASTTPILLFLKSGALLRKFSLSKVPLSFQLNGIDRILQRGFIDSKGIDFKHSIRLAN